MNIKFLKIALGTAFMALAINASAQKNYTDGVAIYNLKTAAGDIESKVLFSADSSAFVSQYGPATVTILANNKDTYLAVLVDVPVASIKKAAIATPDEIDQANSAAPKLTFTPSTETKQINGFNCKKVNVKDDKGNAFAAWITTDVTAPTTSITKYFAAAGGLPVQFTSKLQGQSVEFTLKSITDKKNPAGTFGVPPGFEKISMDDLAALSGGRK